MATEDMGTAARTAPERPPGPPARNGGLLKRSMPTTALGLATLLFFMSIASAFTGAILYAYYEYRLGQTEARISTFETGFGSALDQALGRIDKERDDAVGQVKSQLNDLEKFAASGATLTGVLDKAKPSVWFVQTLDEAGQPSVGSAFVVFADNQQSFLVTSYTTVRAATTKPVPDITLRKGDDSMKGTLTSWDPANDLALLTVDRPSLPALPWAPTSPATQIGDRVFVVSGLGGAGGAISQGFVAGVSAEGIQHDSPVGAAFQGGPLLNSAGQVLAVASRSYAPLGFAPEAVFFGVPIRSSCSKVIKCPDGQAQPG
jgi:S1-C subfamily serine protease